MWVTYKPDGSEPREWWVNLAQIGDSEAESIEARAGMDWTEWQKRLLAGNRRARRALLWTLERRTHHTLRYEDVHFTDENFLVELDAQEIGRAIDTGEKAEAKSGLTDDQRDQLAALRALAETARPAPGKAQEPTDA